MRNFYVCFCFFRVFKTYISKNRAVLVNRFRTQNACNFGSTNNSQLLPSLCTSRALTKYTEAFFWLKQTAFNSVLFTSISEKKNKKLITKLCKSQTIYIVILAALKIT